MSLIPTPRLIRVSLRSSRCEIDESRAVENAPAEMQIQRTIEIEAMPDVEGSPKGRVLVKMDVTAVGFTPDNTERPIVNFDAKYVGYFETEHSIDEVSAEIANSQDYAEKLFLQLFPIATMHFRSTLSMLGANLKMPANAF